jgi:hypothetical protein
MKLILLLIFFFATGISLKPINLPSGNNREYSIDPISRKNDLNLLSPYKARFIARHWENNIMSSGKEIMKEDVHIIRRIDELYKIIDDNNSNIYMSWTPNGVTKDVLFIIVGEINHTKNEFIITMVIQSPYWDTSQIESEHLKYALEELIGGIDDVTLDMTYLYTRDPRFRLSWLTARQNR